MEPNCRLRVLSSMRWGISSRSRKGSVCVSLQQNNQENPKHLYREKNQQKTKTYKTHTSKTQSKPNKKQEQQIRKMNTQTSLSVGHKRLVHFVTDRAGLFTDQRVSGLPIFMPRTSISGQFVSIPLTILQLIQVPLP